MYTYLTQGCLPSDPPRPCFLRVIILTRINARRRYPPLDSILRPVSPFSSILGIGIERTI